MPSQILTDYAFVLAFLSVAVVFAALPIVLAYVVSPRSVGLKKTETYESGITPIGQAWIKFGVTYYLYALIFLAFDVDVLYLFPVLLAYGSYAWRDFIEIVIFVGILSLAIVYAWRRGVFEW
ncbi:MAG: NADH-quinone oxidoreductase subunit A [Thermodesulfobacteriota bacterium]